MGAGVAWLSVTVSLPVGMGYFAANGGRPAPHEVDLGRPDQEVSLVTGDG